MKYTVAGANVKVLGKAVHSLAKIGEELYIEAVESGLILHSVSSSRSAYASFNFVPEFFVSLNKDAPVRCKIALKSCLLAFRSLTTIEKTVETCCFSFTPEDDKLVLQFNCKYDVVKTYHLPFLECETLQALFHTRDCQNVITAQSRLLADAIQNFSSSVEEITLIASPDKVFLRNYVDDEPDPLKIVHTEVCLDAGEFDEYDVIMEVDITFCLKELRALLSFSEGGSLPVSIHFQKGGRPIIFKVKDVPYLEVDFVFATLEEQGQRSGSTAKVSSAAQENRLVVPLKDTNDKKQGDMRELGGPSTSASNLPVTNRQAVAVELSSDFTSQPPSSLQGKGDMPEEGLVNKETTQEECAISAMNEVVSDLEVAAFVMDFGDEDQDVIPSTPPSKKFRSTFLGLSQATEYTSVAPDPDEVLVEASDEDDE